MKKEYKRILILALLAAALFITGGCILAFRGTLSASAAASRGDRAMAHERWNAAIRAYTSAEAQGDTGVSTALSLADAYKHIGNYTKAEYTLVGAINANPESVELCTALSRVYVEQGKFLDADLLLTNISNTEVRQKLAEMRPEPPQLTPEPGYYRAHIDLRAFCSAGRIYLSTDGEYPSSQSQLYTEPITLAGGTTTVCALVADDSGLVSPLFRGEYVISGVIEDIVLSDPGFDKAVRDAIGKPYEEKLVTNELWNLTELTLDGDVRDLSQLSALIGLKKLTVGSIPAMDLSPLAELPQLETLILSGRTLSADQLTAVGQLTELKALDISSCAVQNITPLSGLTGLTELNLANNVISDLDPLIGMTELRKVNLSGNPVPTISALRSCTELTEVDVSGCRLTALNALADREKLETVNAANNQITTLEALRGCTGLKKLNVSGNRLTELSILAQLPQLEVLTADHNNIAVLPQLDKSTAMLRSAELSYNSLTSLEGFRDLQYLNFIFADYNLIESLLPVENCANLIEVSVWNNHVSASSVSALKSHSIIVTYNPNY